MLKNICSFLLILGLSITVFGWNKPGHMLTGAVAYHELKNTDEQAVKNVIELFKKHYYYPRWEQIMTSQNINQADRDLFLFMYATRWSDDVRNDQEHRDKWHYINHPFKPSTEAASVKIFPFDNDNIEKAWSYNISLLQPSEDEDKAKALTWLFHLAGDSHQPLHSSSLYTSLFQRKGGDKGGNSFFVRAAANRATINLHKFWDDAITTSLNFRTIRNLAIEIRTNYPKSSFQNVEETDLAKWIQESFELAKTEVYLNGQLKTGTKTNGEVVPSDYPSRRKEISTQRIALAGYRLANFLSQTF